MPSCKRPSQDLDALIEKISLAPHNILLEFYSSLKRAISFVFDDTYEIMLTTISDHTLFDTIKVSDDMVTLLEKMAFDYFSLSKDSLQNVTFIYKYSEAFYRDFLSFVPNASMMPSYNGFTHKQMHVQANRNFPETVTGLLERLYSWKDMIESQIEKSSLAMNQSQAQFRIQMAHGSSIEVPGQYISTLDPQIYTINEISYILVCQQPKAFSLNVERYLNMVDQRNQPHYFILERINHQSKNEERTMYFQLYMDFFIQNHCLCQRYSIESSYPKYIPININHRLVTYNNSNVGLNSIVDEYMQSKGKDQQRELYDYINRVNVAVTRRREQLTSDELFGSFCESNVLQQYLYIAFIRVNRK